MQKDGHPGWEVLVTVPGIPGQEPAHLRIQSLIIGTRDIQMTAWQTGTALDSEQLEPAMWSLAPAKPLQKP